MIDIEKMKELNPYIQEYRDIVLEGVEKLSPHLSKTKEDLVVGAHIARMATLSVHLMACSVGWNYYMAAFAFRAQVECLITLGWMLQNINENSKQYVVDSIKQNKKNAKEYEKYLSDLVKENPELESDDIFKNIRKEAKESDNEKEEWRQSQQAKWGDSQDMPSVKKRAKTLGPLLESTYIDMYKWLCEHSHNSWFLLDECNTKEIPHGILRAPVISEGIDMRIMESSARYLSIAYEMIDGKYDLKIRITSPIEYWEKHALEIKRIIGR